MKSLFSLRGLHNTRYLSWNSSRQLISPSSMGISMVILHVIPTIRKIGTAAAVGFDRVCFQQDGCVAHNPAKGYVDQTFDVLVFRTICTIKWSARSPYFTL